MVSRLLDREAWSGPLGVARIVAILSATVVLVWSVASLVGLTTYSYKIYFPMTIMLVSLAFLGGYQMGHAKRL
jgi:hypothetical protein